jgi:hypothetical protein
VVLANAPHDLYNVVEGRLRVLGFISSAVVVIVLTAAHGTRPSVSHAHVRQRLINGPPAYRTSRALLASSSPR